MVIQGEGMRTKSTSILAKKRVEIIQEMTNPLEKSNVTAHEIKMGVERASIDFIHLKRQRGRIS
jgi:hypothetical protein